ncbi:hypothetical protein EBS43_00345 [bacterium]|jgi:biopolymer transport protein ExbB/TolQ|nr:hypothetical protein [bacterium]
MLSQLFLGLSLVGSESILYFLILISIFSFALIFERIWFYNQASLGLGEFRLKIRELTLENKLSEAKDKALDRSQSKKANTPDLESEMTLTLLTHAHNSSDVLTELAQDAVIRSRLAWDRNLATLATIGSNAPFVGLFGTVLGIIKSFHDLAQQTNSTHSQLISSGISEALVATAVGLLVAIPAVVAYNVFQRRVKAALAEAEALKSFLIGRLSVSKES